MQTGYKVMDIMTNKPIATSRDMTLKDAAALMAKEDVNSLLILENNQPVGIVTDEDIVRKCVAMGLDSKKLKVKDIASVNIITISPDKDVFEALTIMRDNAIRQLPVVDGHLVGFLTVKDILKIQPELVDLWMEKYEIREESRKMQELDRLAEDDGSYGFFSKLKLKKNTSIWKKNPKKK